MTLRDLIAANPALFYPQSWYADEPFADTEPTGNLRGDFVVVTDKLAPEVRAADLAVFYVETPHDARWRRFIWTDDFDRYGNRVYVGGVGQYGIEAFQIHRHLTIDDRWGWPC